MNFFAFRKLAPTDDRTIVRDSLGYALNLFQHPEEHSFEHYGIGPNAYDNWIRAVPEHGSSHGNWWNGTVWSECRAMASGYFSEIGQKLAPVAAQALELSNAYREIADLLSKAADKEMEPVGKAALLTEAMDKEAASSRRSNRCVLP